MSTVEFKTACAAHRKCCPYKKTSMTKCQGNTKIYEKYNSICGANVELQDGKCLKDVDCWYMAKFKEILREKALK